MFFNKSSTKKVDLTDQSLEFTKADLEVLQEINSVILGEFETEVLLKKIVDITVKYLGCIGTLFIKYEKSSNSLFPKIVSQGLITDIATKLLGNSLDQFKQPLDTGTTFSIRSFKSKKTIVGTNLADFITPPAPKTWAQITQRLYGMQTIISVPVYSQDNEFGVIVYSFNKAQTELPQRLVKLLELYTSQIALALEKAELFANITNKAELLQKQNHDINSLFNLTSKVNQILNFTAAATAAVNSLPQDEYIIGALITSYDDKRNVLHTKSITKNSVTDSALKLINRQLDDLIVDLNNPDFANTLAPKIIKANQPLFTSNLAEVISPPVPKEIVPAIQKILNVSCVVAYPIAPRGKLIGTISYFLRNKQFKDLDNNQIQLLNTYTIQIGTALENALLYEQSIQIQKELKQAYDDLAEARRQERDMVDVMGHELRTPISIVRNALLVLDSDHKKNKGLIAPEKLTRYLKMSVESVRREVTLIETLLSATKLEGHRVQLSFTKIDLAEVIADSIEALKQSALNKALQIEVKQPDGVVIDVNEEADPNAAPPKIASVFVYADRVRTQEIMDNFLSNAIKYTAKGKVQIVLSFKDSMGRVDIIDSGVGIDPADLDKLGKKFFRAQSLFTKDPNLVQPSGTGLGLYVTFELIRIMNGQREIKSVVGQGSDFAFMLPLYSNQPTKNTDQTFMKQS